MYNSKLNKYLQYMLKVIDNLLAPIYGDLHVMHGLNCGYHPAPLCSLLPPVLDSFFSSYCSVQPAWFSERQFGSGLAVFSLLMLLTRRTELLLFWMEERCLESPHLFPTATVVWILFLDPLDLLGVAIFRFG
jgi:hypothetical protein